jgi:hypothetical protein
MGAVREITSTSSSIRLDVNGLKCRRKNPRTNIETANMPSKMNSAGESNWPCVTCPVRATADRTAKNPPVTMNQRPR